MYLVTAQEMQTIDRETIASFGLPGRVLMENAGRGATRFFLDQMMSQGAFATVGVIAGRGNNGGDGFVVARCLAQKGIRVHVYLLSDARRLKGDAAANHALLAPLGIEVTEIPAEKDLAVHQSAMTGADCWIDAILGTGLKTKVKGYFARVIEFINRLNRPVFAVDIPSGLDADTGQPLGACIRAAATATFGFAKIGHWVYPGAEYTGRLGIVDIGIPGITVASVAPRQRLIDAESVRRALPQRPADSHKGRSGHLMVVAGSPGKTGAAAMTATSAARVGAGLVTLGAGKSLNAVLESQVLEAMTLPLPETQPGVPGLAALDAILTALQGKKCLAIGPGLSPDKDTGALVRQLVARAEVPMVIDADGLNHLVGSLETLRQCRVPVILTPHPGEMARLTGLSVAEIQQDRVGCTRRFSERHRVYVVLKGARSVVAHPDGSVGINPTGNAGMASGGMGDVLTGAIAGLLTQGLEPGLAAHCGVYLHGAAADILSERVGPYGYLAGEVMTALPEAIGATHRGERSAAERFENIF